MEDNCGALKGALNSARARLNDKTAQLKRINDELDAAQTDYKQSAFNYLDGQLKALRDTRLRRRLALALALIVIGLLLLFIPLPIYVPIIYLVVAVVLYIIVLSNSSITRTIQSAAGAIRTLRAEELEEGSEAE